MELHAPCLHAPRELNLHDIVGNPHRWNADSTSRYWPLWDAWWGRPIEEAARLWRDQNPLVANTPAPFPDYEDPCIHTSTQPPCGSTTQSLQDSFEGDDVLPGCFFLRVPLIKRSRPVWVRANYIRVYDAILQQYIKLIDNDSPFLRTHSAVLTGQPGVGELLWIFSFLLLIFTYR